MSNNNEDRSRMFFIVGIIIGLVVIMAFAVWFVAGFRSNNSNSNRNTEIMKKKVGRKTATPVIHRPPVKRGVHIYIQ